MSDETCDHPGCLGTPMFIKQCRILLGMINKYCVNHTCLYKGYLLTSESMAFCYCYAADGNSACKRHMCQASGCTYMVKMDGLFCRNHACGYSPRLEHFDVYSHNCKKMALEGCSACEEHLCTIKLCTKEREWNDVHCYLHKCNYYALDDNGTMTRCKRHVPEGKGTCPDHICKIAECQSVCETNSDLCYYHGSTR